MAYTEDDLTAIRAAITKGERTVQFADRSVTYRSIDELLQAEARILGELAQTARRPRQFIATSGKGLC